MTIPSTKSGQARSSSTFAEEDIDGQIEGLTPGQLTVLAQKVYALLLEELRIEEERHGGIRSHFK